MEYNVYCDESCHLENDRQSIMVLGAIWCPKEDATLIFKRLREIKQEHDLSASFELKWSKVSLGKIDYYMDVLNYFFDNDRLHFRVLVAKDKHKLDHTNRGQDHDTWYYKMYYYLLNVILSPSDKYYVYLDIKDTRSSEKMRDLHDVISCAKHDFDKTIVRRIQTVRSNEVELIQLADLLIGAVAYANRSLSSNAAKCRIIERMRERAGYDLLKPTLLRENKVNVFIWTPSEQRRD